MEKKEIIEENKRDKEYKRYKDMVEKLNTEELMKILVEKMKDETPLDEEEDKQVKEVKQELKEENLYSGYLEGFDEEFETHTQMRVKQTPMLLKIFGEFSQEVYKPSKLYCVASTAKTRIREELTRNMNEDEKMLLNQLKLCEDRVLDDMLEQAFIYGYAVAVQMKDEAITQYPDKKE